MPALLPSVELLQACTSSHSTGGGHTYGELLPEGVDTLMQVRHYAMHAGSVMAA
jgi:hypothetical protein